jgi:hypothetical protein
MTNSNGKSGGLFRPVGNDQAYFKGGFLGFAGDGKTFTSSLIAIGLVEAMRKAQMEKGNKPWFFIDTETGSDWVAPLFKKAGIELFVAKTRAFTDLIAAMEEAEKSASGLTIDSISHFWREYCDSFLKQKNDRLRKRNRRQQYNLEFQDWAQVKAGWGRFTDLFVNSSLHICMCGRAGYEYDFAENDDGKKELEKTGIKMRAETETGYEPNLLVLMEKHRDVKTGEAWRTASILKDRSNTIDGKQFRNPTFESFAPHIACLNLGGEHLGVDLTRNSESEFDTDDGSPTWHYEKRQKEIALDEILELLKKHFPSQSAADKTARQELLEKHAGTLSWKRIETFDYQRVSALREMLWTELENRPYTLKEQPPELTLEDDTIEFDM